MSTSRTLLKSARLFHLYSGVFFTPALLFFAFTGAVQSMNFHEVTRGRDYKPPAILVKLAQLHKKETLVLPPERKPGPSAAASPKRDRPERSQSPEAPSPGASTSSPAPAPKPDPAPPQQKSPNTLPLKIFSFWTGVGLFLSTLTGLFMAYRYTHNKIAISATLLAGILIPAVLLLVQ
jgi:hypothetical protein